MHIRNTNYLRRKRLTTVERLGIFIFCETRDLLLWLRVLVGMDAFQAKRNKH